MKFNFKIYIYFCTIQVQILKILEAKFFIADEAEHSIIIII